MRLCAIDTSLNEKISAKHIANLIDEKIADVTVKILKQNIFSGPALKRENLLRSHILMITIPRKALTAELALELASYIDIGGCLLLTLPAPDRWIKLGRWFNQFRRELGINFDVDPVFGLPKVNDDTRLIGSPLKLSKAYHIYYNSDTQAMKENGIKEYIPLAYIDNKPIVVAAYKRRGSFVVFSSEEMFTQSNSLFINRLLYLCANRKKFKLDEKNPKIQVGTSNYFILLQHAVYDTYRISIFHHDYLFYKSVITNASFDHLADFLEKHISSHKTSNHFPSRIEIEKTAQKLLQMSSK